MPTIPEPNYEYDIKILRQYYEKALSEIERSLLRLNASEFERAMAKATIADIKEILAELDGSVSEWTAKHLEGTVKDGIIRSMLALEVVETVAEAEKVLTFSRINRELVKTAVADTQADLLAVTKNVERKVRIAIREATMETMRANLTQGINGTQTLKRDILAKLDKATKTGIIDAAGRRWKPGVYAETVVQTKMMLSHKEATINEALSRDVLYGIISSHGAKDACSRWEGKVVKLIADAPGDYPYVGDLPRNEIFHPRCKHLITPVRKPERYLSER